MNLKALRAGCASRGAEVSCKQHRQGAKESQATLYSPFHDWNTPDRKQKPDKLSKMYIVIKIK